MILYDCAVYITATLVQQGMVDAAATTLFWSARYLVIYGLFETVLIWRIGDNSILVIYHTINWQNHKWYTYKHNVISIVNKGITKTVLHALTLEICCVNFLHWSRFLGQINTSLIVQVILLTNPYNWLFFTYDDNFRSKCCPSRLLEYVFDRRIT